MKKIFLKTNKNIFGNNTNIVGNDKKIFSDTNKNIIGNEKKILSVNLFILTTH
jgi:hypothetical protein